MLEDIISKGYDGRRFTIFIAVPKGFDSTDVGGWDARIKSIQDSAQHIFKSDKSENIIPSEIDILKSRDKENIIPSEKIIGYVDRTNFEFLKNPKFPA